ncbi:MAG TPA: ice-binding family protein [Polyangia bacterium]|nr:ice-binding family protein [Polyangia bacterium]
MITASKLRRLAVCLAIIVPFAALPLACGPPETHSQALAATAPALGTLASFAVLGGSTVTNTNPTVVTGNLGVSPGSAVTGFPPGLVIGGTIHAADAVALQAQVDDTTAYKAIAGLACDHDLTGQDLVGHTLIPGVYCFSSSAQLSGALTLDAQGDPSAAFIFQIGSTLTTASNASVRVINGGNGCNVFWQVGSSATLGTGTTFVGTILALTSITLTTGASLSGRALAQNGAVTMDSNTVLFAVCDTTSASDGGAGGVSDGGASSPPVCPTVSTVTVDRSTGVLADGIDHAVVTISLHDCNGNPIVGQAVTLTATGSHDLLTQPGPTDSNGVTTGALASTTAELKIITASSGGATLPQMPTVEFVSSVSCCQGSACGNSCFDLQTDRNHCGACDRACAANENCQHGTCTTCQRDLCGTDCVDTVSDRNHCGNCGTVCPPNVACVGGYCGPCPGTMCGSWCVDLQTDGHDCGACGNACPANERCVHGSCALICQ